MNYKQKRKLFTILGILSLLFIATGFTLFALKQNINLFYTPTELIHQNVPLNKAIRIGGYVKDKSVQYDKKGEKVSFVITDRKNELYVQYHGILPNLFREGQTVVVTGKLGENHILMANQVLAKHDEKYMPKSLEKNDHSSATTELHALADPSEVKYTINGFSPTQKWEKESEKT